MRGPQEPDTPMFCPTSGHSRLLRKRLHSQKQSEERDTRGVSADECTDDSSQVRVPDQAHHPTIAIQLTKRHDSLALPFGDGDVDLAMADLSSSLARGSSASTAMEGKTPERRSQDGA
jgi:hypothetical protein